MNRVVLAREGAVTSPQEVREALHIDAGDDVLFTVTEGDAGDDVLFTVTEGGVLLRGLKFIPADQAWFWSEQWQRGEREASAQLATGTVHSDGRRVPRFTPVGADHRATWCSVAEVLRGSGGSRTRVDVVRGSGGRKVSGG